MTRNFYLPFLLGALAVIGLALAAAQATGPKLIEGLDHQARTAIGKGGGKGVVAHFVDSAGWVTRHPVLTGGEKLSETVRDRIAKAIGAISGVGGVHWADSSGLAASQSAAPRSLHCQDDVEALLRARSIRFEESSATIEPASRDLIDEVAAALRPCLGSIIAITGHTDASGPEPANLALSQARAEAVRAALIAREIPADGVRAKGVGSTQPVDGLDPRDPANRRIDFSVIAAMPLNPTPVDTPAAH